MSPNKLQSECKNFIDNSVEATIRILQDKGVIW